MAPDYEKMTPEQLRYRRNSAIGVGLAGVGVNGLVWGLEGIVSRLAPEHLDTVQQITTSPNVTMPALLLGIGAVTYAFCTLCDYGRYRSLQKMEQYRQSINKRNEEHGLLPLAVVAAQHRENKLRRRAERRKNPNREYLRPWLPITELYAPLLRRCADRIKQAFSRSDQGPRPDA